MKIPHDKYQNVDYRLCKDLKKLNEKVNKILSKNFKYSFQYFYY